MENLIKNQVIHSILYMLNFIILVSGDCPCREIRTK